MKIITRVLCAFLAVTLSVPVLAAKPGGDGNLWFEGKVLEGVNGDGGSKGSGGSKGASGGSKGRGESGKTASTGDTPKGGLGKTPKVDREVGIQTPPKASVPVPPAPPALTAAAAAKVKAASEWEAEVAAAMTRLRAKWRDPGYRGFDEGEYLSELLLGPLLISNEDELAEEGRDTLIEAACPLCDKLLKIAGAAKWRNIGLEPFDHAVKPADIEAIHRLIQEEEKQLRENNTRLGLPVVPLAPVDPDKEALVKALVGLVQVQSPTAASVVHSALRGMNRKSPLAWPAPLQRKVADAIDSKLTANACYIPGVGTCAIPGGFPTGQSCWCSQVARKILYRPVTGSSIRRQLGAYCAAGGERCDMTVPGPVGAPCSCVSWTAGTNHWWYEVRNAGSISQFSRADVSAGAAREGDTDLDGFLSSEELLELGKKKK
jgi:hypothetical protein